MEENKVDSSTNTNKINESCLNMQAAMNLSHTTMSVPMMEEISPRWSLTFLSWVAVEAGTYRVNSIKKGTKNPTNACNEYGEKAIELLSCHHGEPMLPQTFPDYEENPREYPLSLIQTILRVHTRISDIYNSPIIQLKEQMRLTVEAMKERQEWEIINNPDFGLIHSVAPAMRIKPRTGVPTPDDMDELLARVWKKPAFFLAHPKAIAAFGRECTNRGVPPATVNIYGSPFITWRGVPLVPCDKLLVDGRARTEVDSGKTSILLMRVGENEQGVVGLHQPGIPDEQNNPSLSVKFGGIDQKSIAYYVLSLYFSVAVLTSDALGMLENVEVGYYHDRT
jgi:hypothetical protein